MNTTENNLINKCLKLSSDAYRDDKSLISNNEAYVICKKNKTIYIAFRGSDDVMDWVDNTKVGFVSHNGVLVHGGFYNALKECLPFISGFISRHYDYGDKFLLTGHSKGSAMALLMGNDLIAQGYLNSSIQFVGFATPRVVKTSSVELFNRHRFNILLCELEGDPVPSLPRQYMGYSKVYDRIEIKEMSWWRKLIGFRAYNHKLSEYKRKFYTKESFIVTKFKSIRARMGVRG